MPCFPGGRPRTVAVTATGESGPVPVCWNVTLPVIPPGPEMFANALPSEALAAVLCPLSDPKAPSTPAVSSASDVPANTPAPQPIPFLIALSPLDRRPLRKKV
jgi:hypothetical protein